MDNDVPAIKPVKENHFRALEWLPKKHEQQIAN